MKGAAKEAVGDAFDDEATEEKGERENEAGRDRQRRNDAVYYVCRDVVSGSSERPPDGARGVSIDLRATLQVAYSPAWRPSQARTSKHWTDTSSSERIATT